MWPFKKKQKVSKRMFAGALISRLTEDWIAQGTSIDAEIKSSLIRLRNRSRQLGRDNDYIRNFYREVQNNVIGQGIRLQSKVKMQRGNALDQKTNDLIENAWEEWKRAENCDVTGKMSFPDLERLITRAVFESGEFIVRFVYQKMGSAPTPLSLEVIESDLLDDNYNAISPQGNAIRMGVELNPWGRPVAYWFFHRHPGDYGVVPDLQAENGRRIRIPADEIIHGFFTDRPKQTRGSPAIASALIRLRHMQGYEEAEVIAARASAALMGFIETPEIEPSIQDAVDDGQSVTEFEPGVIKKLNPGEKVTVPTSNRPGGQFDPFMSLMLRGVAAGAGCSYETVSKDYSRSNYSSSRMSLLPERDNWRVIQQWVIANFHQRVFEKWLDISVLSGVLPLKNYETMPQLYRNPQWKPRGWAWVDPQKEVVASLQAVRAGFKTLADVVSDGGGDLDELMTQRQDEVTTAAELKLVFDSDPAQVNKLGVEQPTAPQEQQADAAEGPDVPDQDA